MPVGVDSVSRLTGGSPATPDGWLGRVPCFFEAAPQGNDDKIAAGLCFRVGMVDEPLPQRGISHLVEHLTLARMAGRTERYNGFVDSLTTNFMIHGTPAEVVEFFSVVCAALGAPDHARVDREAPILRAEASRRGVDPMASIMNWRVGAGGYGALNYREFFLERPATAWVDYWIAQNFTEDNAVFWCTGPIPDGLALPLRPGPRRATPEPRWLPETYPAWNADDVGGVVLSLLRPPTIASATAVEVARIRLFDQLREARGISYEVGSRSEEVGTQLSHVLLHADCVPEQLAAARDAAVTEFHRLCLYGPTEDEVSRVKSMVGRSLDDAEGSDAGARARSHLVGRPYFTEAEVRDQLDRVDAELVRSELDAMARSAMWVVPMDPGWRDRRYEQVRPWSTVHATGRPIAAAAQPGESDPRTLVVDEQRVTMFQDPERRCAVTVDFADCAALVHAPDGARTLIGDDGFVLRVEPWTWPDSASLLSWIDGRVPAERVVVLGRT